MLYYSQKEEEERKSASQALTRDAFASQVPAGKELVRPEACFVAKTYILPQKDPKATATTTATASAKGEKIFINIVQSSRVAAPVGTNQVY